MSNYSRYKSRRTRSIDSGWLTIIAIPIIALLMILASNACTAKEWNGGKCPDCNVRYELRGVYKGTHYYACPDCGNEVDRFGGK
jgi:hypothetical protein